MPSVVPPHVMSAALFYARLGWPVFPCSDTKAPLTSNGFKDATTDEGQVKLAWTEHDGAAIGIATGQALGSNLLVVDLDSYKPGRTAEFDAWCNEHGGLPFTLSVRTGQGGRQFYYTTDEPIRNKSGNPRGDWFDNVDIRADGGYVIAAPSSTIFGAYEIIDERRPEPAPEWLLERLRPRAFELATQPAFDPTGFTDAERERLNGYTARAVSSEVDRLRECSSRAVAPGQGYSGPLWDQTTYEVACNLIEFANSAWTSFSETDAHDLLLAEAPQDPTFTLRDVQAKWDSARKTVGTKSRPMPENRTPAVTVVVQPGQQTGQVLNPDLFFDRAGLDTAMFAQAVLDLGPLAIEDNPNRSVWTYRNGVWGHAPNELSNRAALLLGKRFRADQVKTLKVMVQAMLERNGQIIPAKPDEAWTNCRNGMLRWATGELLPHDPSYFSTVQINAEWDPTADCPTFDVFVKEVMADDALAYIWQIIGYLLLSGNPLQKAVLFHGAGSNGKGTLIRAATHLLGERNCSNVTLTEMSDNRFKTSAMVGKIANMAGDLDPKFLKATGVFKNITGEDTISVERKYEGEFSYQVWATPVFSANEFWKSIDVSHGYMRRWLLVPFPHEFGISAGFSESFEHEHNGMLRKAVAGLQQLMARGDFDPPPSALVAKTQFEEAADSISEWLNEDEAVIAHDPDDKTTYTEARKVWDAYKAWASDSGTTTVPLGKFRQRLMGLGYEYRKAGSMRVYGLTLTARQTFLLNP